MAKPEFNAVVVERADLAPGLFNLRVVPEGWEYPDFEPGQFAILGLLGSAPRIEGSKPDKKPAVPDKFIQRAYSIASSPLLKDYLEFNIVMVDDGALTPRLALIKPGDKVWLSPRVSGKFTIKNVPDEANIVFVGTGTGIAPFVSMLQTYPPSQKKRKHAVFQGVRRTMDLAYRSELWTMDRVCDNFNYFPMVSRPHLDVIPWKGPVGHVQKLWEEKVLDKAWGFHPTPADTHFLLCGSPGMIDGMLDILGKEGFKEHKKDEPGQIHVERYW